jgi:hypothetical protein
MSNIAVIAKITAQPGKRADVIAGMASMIAHVESEAGTVVYTLLEDQADADVMWVYEEYADLIEEDMKSGALSGYDTFPFADFINAKRIVRHRLIAEIAKTNTYQIPCFAGSLGACMFANGDILPCELLIDRKIPAASLFSGPYYFLEQLGFRKIIDTTFMMAAMVTGEPDIEDVRKYYAALRRAQHDIDLRPELYTRFYRNEFPLRFHEQMDTGRWGPGERIVFEPYSRDMFEDSQAWIAARDIFEGDLGHRSYAESILTLA